MKENPIFYTASMAKLCADQGYFDKSADIYRYLLTSGSGDETLRQALAAIEVKQAAVAGVSGAAEERLERLAPMIKKWVGLMVEHDLKLKFDKIRRSVKHIQSQDNEI